MIVKTDATKVEGVGDQVTSVVGGVESKGLKAAVFYDADPNDMVNIYFKDTQQNSNLCVGGDENCTPTTPSLKPEQPGFEINIDQEKAISKTYIQAAINARTNRMNFLSSVISEALNQDLNTTQELSANQADENATATFMDYSNMPGNLFFVPYTGYMKASYNTNHAAKSSSVGSIIGFAKDYKDRGKFGVYSGYVDGRTKAGYSQEIDDDEFFVGGFYRKDFDGFYVKSLLDASFTNSDVYRGDIKAKTQADSLGVETMVGKEYILAKDILIPEVGVSYQRYNFKNFAIGRERYKDAQLNLTQAVASLSWLRQVGKNLNTNIKLGTRINALGRKMDSEVTIYDKEYTINNKLPRAFGFADVGLEYQITDNTRFLVSYNFAGAKDTQSHTGYAKVDYRW